MTTHQFKTHWLKTHSEPFQAVWDGRKTFEWRREDRDGELFRIDDELVLAEVEPERLEATGREIKARVTYVLRNQDFGVPKGYCVLSIRVHETVEPFF